MNNENMKDVFSILSSSANKSLHTKDNIVNLRNKSYEIIYNKFIDSPQNLCNVAKNIHRLITNTAQQVQYKSGEKITGNEFVLLEIPFDFYSIYVKIKLSTQKIVDYMIYKTSESAEVITNEEKQTLMNFIKTIIIGDYMEYPELPIECILSTLCLELNLLRPVSTESLSVNLKSNGLQNDIITSYNMFIRTILYKLKRCGLIIMSDDEEYDNEDSITQSLDRVEQVDILIEDTLKHLIDLIGIEEYNKCLVNTNQVTYIKDIMRNMFTTTVIGDELDIQTIQEVLFKYIDEWYSSQKEVIISNPPYITQNILGVILYAIRMILFKETSEKNNSKNLEFEGKQ